MNNPEGYCLSGVRVRLQTLSFRGEKGSMNNPEG